MLGQLCSQFHPDWIVQLVMLVECLSSLGTCGLLHFMLKFYNCIVAMKCELDALDDREARVHDDIIIIGSSSAAMMMMMSSCALVEWSVVV